MIAVIDYGMGNLRSVQKGFERVGHEAVVTSDKATILDADKVVLPGVGAFADCMRNLDQLGLVDTVRKVIDSGRPFMGICLGLQLLFEEGEEFGIHEGLGVLKGRVVRFPAEVPGNTEQLYKIPHMGWNRIKIKRLPAYLKDIADGGYFYFVHSYYVVPRIWASRRLPPNTAWSSSPASGKTIYSPPSFIRKRARNWGLRY